MEQQGTRSTWMRAKTAADYSSTSAKTIYSAIKEGKLRAAPIGAGRNFLTCRAWVDEWLTNCAGVEDQH